MRVISIFHPCKLYLALLNPFLGQIIILKPPILIQLHKKETLHKKWKLLELVNV